MAKLSPVPARGIEEAQVKIVNAAQSSSKVSPVSPAGPRKLIRPGLPPRTFAGRSSASHARFFPLPAPAYNLRTESFAQHTSHAETFYLQKQVHQRTLMVLVLEDGEQIEGYIEWYDSNAIKIRNGGRMLVYKSSIKYLYKANESFRL